MSADGDNLACRLHGLTRHNSERGPFHNSLGPTDPVVSKEIIF
jgi:hypothetical protein